MDTSKKAESAHLLDDLESIRKLLGDENLQPPLLTETVHREEQIPLLFDIVDSAPQPPAHSAQPAAHAIASPVVEPSPPVLPSPPAALPELGAPPSVDALLHLDSELRSAAQLIMQDVISDFAPHIETEIKRRLEARLERLLATTGSKN